MTHEEAAIHALATIWPRQPHDAQWEADLVVIARAIRGAAMDERDRCAKVCEDSVVDHGGILECTLTPYQLAKKIRDGSGA